MRLCGSRTLAPTMVASAELTAVSTPTATRPRATVTSQPVRILAVKGKLPSGYQRHAAEPSTVASSWRCWATSAGSPACMRRFSFCPVTVRAPAHTRKNHSRTPHPAHRGSHLTGTTIERADYDAKHTFCRDVTDLARVQAPSRIVA